jgi:hypothetical protein
MQTATKEGVRVLKKHIDDAIYIERHLISDDIMTLFYEK